MIHTLFMLLKVTLTFASFYKTNYNDLKLLEILNITVISLLPDPCVSIKKTMTTEHPILSLKEHEPVIHTHIHTHSYAVRRLTRKPMCLLKPSATVCHYPFVL